MSRSGYTDDSENAGLWRGTVFRAIRGKRGQAMLLDLLAALDAMPDKRLIAGHLADTDGEVCALGALGKYRRVDLSKCEERIDRDGYCDDPEYLAQELASAFDIAKPLAQEVQYMNDEHFDFTYINNELHYYTPEERWQKMRDWVISNLQSFGL